MNKSKILKKDAIIWVVLMGLAALIAYNLLQRDHQRNFGAVSFGSFPEFETKTIEGETLNRPRMKNRVWAIHSASSEGELKDIAKQLQMVEESTASGKRHLYILSMANFNSTTLKPLKSYHSIVLGSPKAMMPLRSQDVLLVDQNAIIRGVYDFKDVDDYRKFQQDLRRLL